MDELNINDQSSREEKILGSMTGDYNGQLEPPMSRVEQLLLKLKDKIGSIAKDLGGITEISFEKVKELPSEPKSGVIYLVPNKHSEKDLFDEYMWLGDAWEKLGNTDIDLSQYVTKDELETKIKEQTVTYALKLDGDELTLTDSNGNKQSVSMPKKEAAIDDNGIVTLGGATMSKEGIITI